jgi:hypothetical protein
MRLESANSARDNVTSADIEEFFANEELRGEFIILLQDDDHYIQAAGEKDNDCILEYRDGSGDEHYRAANILLSKAEIKQAFMDYLHGDTRWHARWKWEKLDFSGANKHDPGAVRFGGLPRGSFTWKRLWKWLRTG